MYFLYWEAQLGRRNGTECVPVRACACVCTLMSCLFFTGDSPSSLAGSQDLFSRLYITANNIIETVCPFLSLPPPPPPSVFVPLMLPGLPYPTFLSVWDLIRPHYIFALCSSTTVTPMGSWCDGWGTGAIWPHPKRVVWYSRFNRMAQKSA